MTRKEFNEVVVPELFDAQVRRMTAVEEALEKEFGVPFDELPAPVKLVAVFRAMSG